MGNEILKKKKKRFTEGQRVAGRYAVGLQSVFICATVCDCFSFSADLGFFWNFYFSYHIVRSPRRVHHICISSALWGKKTVQNMQGAIPNFLVSKSIGTHDWRACFVVLLHWLFIPHAVTKVKTRVCYGWKTSNCEDGNERIWKTNQRHCTNTGHSQYNCLCCYNILKKKVITAVLSNRCWPRKMKHFKCCKDKPLNRPVVVSANLQGAGVRRSQSTVHIRTKAEASPEDANY